MSQLAASDGQPGNWEEPGSFCVGLRPWGLKRKAGRSRVNREVHARICGSVGVRFPCATRLGTWVIFGFLARSASIRHSIDACKLLMRDRSHEIFRLCFYINGFG